MKDGPGGGGRQGAKGGQETSSPPTSPPAQAAVGRNCFLSHPRLWRKELDSVPELERRGKGEGCEPLTGLHFPQLMGTREAETEFSQLLSKVDEQQKTWRLRQQVQISGPPGVFPEKEHTLAVTPGGLPGHGRSRTSPHQSCLGQGPTSRSASGSPWLGASPPIALSSDLIEIKGRK